MTNKCACTYLFNKKNYREKIKRTKRNSLIRNDRDIKNVWFTNKEQKKTCKCSYARLKHETIEKRINLNSSASTIDHSMHPTESQNPINKKMSIKFAFECSFLLYFNFFVILIFFFAIILYFMVRNSSSD